MSLRLTWRLVLDGDEMVSAFRAFLLVFFLCLGGYTWLVGANHGWNLLPLSVGSGASERLNDARLRGR